MIQNKKTFFIGIFLLIVSSSYLGLPSAWKTFLIFLSSIILMVLSVKFDLVKKPQKRQRKKEKLQGIVSEDHKTPISTNVEVSSDTNNPEVNVTELNDISHTKKE